MEFIQNIDTAILMFIHNNFTSPLLDSFMPAITSIGNAGCIWIVLCLILLLSKRHRKYGFMLAGALILCLLIGNVGLKPLIARERPFNFNDAITLLISTPLDYSFPSGHTMSSFASAAILYYMNKKVGIAAYVLASVIAFSRLYLYVHYPSDVLAGVLIGILIARIVIKITEKIDKKNNYEKVNIS